jgi:hypothetical protein
VLARFAQYPDGGIEPQPYRMNRAMRRLLSSWTIAIQRQRPDGGATWQLPRCPQGHYRPVRHERLAGEFEHYPAGQNDVRVCL